MNVTWEDGMAESRLAGSRCRSGEPFVSLPLSLSLSCLRSARFCCYSSVSFWLNLQQSLLDNGQIVNS